MSTEYAKNKNGQTGRTGFESTFKDFKDMCDGMTECCGEQGGSIDCSAMRERMSKTMMEMCCGVKNNNSKSDH